MSVCIVKKVLGQKLDFWYSVQRYYWVEGHDEK